MSNANLPERVSEQRDLIVNHIVELMESEGLSWTRGWSNAFSPFNAVSSEPYRGSNRLNLALIANIRDYDDPRWVTFNQAKKNGWKVKKGAVSAVVEKWKMLTFTKEIEGDDGNPDYVTMTFPRCVGYWSVFNACEVEGMPDLVMPTLAQDSVLDTADSLIASSRCPVHERTSRLRYADIACYSPLEDAIYMPGRNQFSSSQSFLRVLLHEMMHSTSKPLGRDVLNSFGTPAYAFEELIAELGSAFASAEIGFDATAGDLDQSSEYHKQHAAYIKSWLAALRDDPNQLYRAATEASKAVDLIISQWRGKMAA